jgi:transcriptional regulator with XRE-family HTH domain
MNGAPIPKKAGWKAQYLALLSLLTRLRQDKGITQDTLAENLGISPRMLQYYEAREKDVPAALLCRWMAELGVSLTFSFNPPSATLRVRLTG